MREPEQHQKVCVVDAARMLVDLVHFFCFAGWFHKMRWHGCAQQSIGDAPTLVYAGLQLKVAKRLGTAAGKIGLGHNSTFLLCSIAAGGC